MQKRTTKINRFQGPRYHYYVCAPKGAEVAYGPLRRNETIQALTQRLYSGESQGQPYSRRLLRTRREFMMGDCGFAKLLMRIG